MKRAPSHSSMGCPLTICATLSIAYRVCELVLLSRLVALLIVRAHLARRKVDR